MKYREFDNDKFIAILKAKHICKSEVETKLHRSSGWLVKCLKRGTMAANDLDLLENKFGISYNDIKQKNEPSKNTRLKINLDDNLKSDLEQLIYRAVYSAALHAWEDDRPRSEVLK